MSARSTRCDNCGAQLRSRAGARCAFCDAELVRGTAGGAPPPRAWSFEALSAHPEFARWMSHVPEAVGGPRRVLLRMVFLVLFLGAALFMALRSTDTLPRVLSVVFALLALRLLLRSLGQDDSAAPLTRRAAAVVRAQRERQDDGIPSHKLHLELEFEGGATDRFVVRAERFRRLERGHMGVAFLRGGRLDDFQKIEVQ